MKKASTKKSMFIFFMIAMVSTLVLGACGARSESSASASTSSASTAAQKDSGSTEASSGKTAANSASNKKIVIKFSHDVAENTPKGQAALLFKKLAEKYTHGRVEVKVYPDSQLYNDNQVLAAVQQNNVQLAAPATSKVSKLFPQWSVFDLPFAFKDEATVRKAMNSKEIGGKLFTMLEGKGLLGLAMWDNGFKQMTDDRRPLIKPSDFKGLKFRIMPSDVLKAQFKVVGADPIPMPFSEVYNGLEQGVINGEENTLSNIYSKKFYEVQKYLTISNHGYLGYAVITNAKFWNGLPSDIRQELERALKESTQWIDDNAQKINQDDLKKIKASSHIKIHVLTPQEKQAWVDKMSSVYDQKEKVVGSDLINAIKAMRKP